MTKSFDYLYTTSAMSSVEVKDIGNTLIQAFNDNGLEWFLYIKTLMGETVVKIFGPFHVQDETYFPYGFVYTLSKFDYNEKKLLKIIDNFINDPKKNITQVLVDNEKELFYNKITKMNILEMG